VKLLIQIIFLDKGFEEKMSLITS